MHPVTVVTDSTAYLPADLRERHGIVQVSLYYTFDGGEPHREVDLEDYDAFYDELRASDSPPTTSPPSVEDFVAVYEPLLADGRSIVSVHISSGLSETCANARQAVDQLTASGKGGERVQVFDSASVAGQLALVALSAAKVAATGDADAVADLARQARLEAKMWWAMDTLEFLRRGGRIGSAAAWIGSTLSIKPILTVESEIKPVERVRTRERAVERLVELGRQLHAAGANAWMVQHSDAAEEALALAKRLEDVFRRPPEMISELGPVIGTHLGPNVLALGGIPPRFLE